MPKIDLDFFEKILFQQILKKDNTFLAACVDHLDKELFKNKDIGVIVGIIKDFYLERDAIPTHTELKVRINESKVREHLEKAVKEIRDLDKEYDEDELIANTEYFLKQRKTELVLTKAVEEKVANKAVDLDEYQKENEKISNICLIDNLGLDYFGDNHRVVSYLEEVDTLISTGFKGLDNAIGGGLMAEGRALYCISGETNAGKSVVLANIAVNLLLQNKNVVLYTLEMSEKRYAKRISGILTGIAIASLKDNISSYKEYIRDFVEKYRSKLIIKEFPTKSITAKNIYAYTMKLMRHKKCRFDVMLFDYHTLLKPSLKQPSKHDELQFITQECRGLTYTLECPGITVAQLNRGSHKQQKPGLDNAAGSWNQISDFDAWVTLAQTDEDREANILRFYGDKCRDGMKGNTGIFNVDYNTLRLTDPDNMIVESIHTINEIDSDTISEIDLLDYTD